MTKRIILILLIEITLGLIASGAIIPALAEPEWTVNIDGDVSNPTTLNITQLMAMPSKTVYAELYCYGAYVTAGNWTGVQLNLLLEYVEADPNAMSLGFSATDGYSREISITEVMQDNVILAYEINGVPLSETLRLVLPGSNGEFWVAMINHITISTNSAPYTYSGTGVNLPTLNPTLQPSPTITPTTPTPTPVDSPFPTPTTTPKPTITSTPPPQASPTLPYEAGAGTILILLIIGIAYFMKKR